MRGRRIVLLESIKEALKALNAASLSSSSSSSELAAGSTRGRRRDRRSEGCLRGDTRNMDDTRECGCEEEDNSHKSVASIFLVTVVVVVLVVGLERMPGRISSLLQNNRVQRTFTVEEE